MEVALSTMVAVIGQTRRYGTKKGHIAHILLTLRDGDLGLLFGNAVFGHLRRTGRDISHVDEFRVRIGRQLTW